MELTLCKEKRKHRRTPVRLPLDYWETPDLVQGGLVADMSEGGLCIHSIHPIQIGAELKIRIYISKDEYRFDYLEGNGKIIWRSLHQESGWKGYKYGLYVVQMALHDREKVRQLLKELPIDQGSSEQTSDGRTIHLCPSRQDHVSGERRVQMRNDETGPLAA